MTFGAADRKLPGMARWIKDTYATLGIACIAIALILVFFAFMEGKAVTFILAAYAGAAGLGLLWCAAVLEVMLAILGKCRPTKPPSNSRATD